MAGQREACRSQIAMVSTPRANQVGLNLPGLSNPSPAQSLSGAAQKQEGPWRSWQLVTVTLPLCLPLSPCFSFLCGTLEIHLLSPLCPMYPLPVSHSKSNGYFVILPFPETLLHSLVMIHSLSLSSQKSQLLISITASLPSLNLSGCPSQGSCCLFTT